MGLMSSVTLNTVVYSVAGFANGVAMYVSRVAGVLAGFARLKVSYKEPTSGTQTKIDFNLSIPVVSTEDSDCSCAGTLLRTNSAVVSVWVASTSTTAERENLARQIKDLTASAMFVAAVKDLDPPTS